MTYTHPLQADIRLERQDGKDYFSFHILSYFESVDMIWFADKLFFNISLFCNSPAHVYNSLCRLPIDHSVNQWIIHSSIKVELKAFKSMVLILMAFNGEKPFLEDTLFAVCFKWENAEEHFRWARVSLVMSMKVCRIPLRPYTYLWLVALKTSVVSAAFLLAFLKESALGAKNGR